MKEVMIKEQDLLFIESEFKKRIESLNRLTKRIAKKRISNGQCTDVQDVATGSVHNDSGESKTKEFKGLVKLEEIDFDESILTPLKSNTYLDKLFSADGGIFPATNYIIIGDAGSGKTTISLHFGANVQKTNPGKNVLFISGEMTRIDMYSYIRRFPEIKKLTTFFINEFENFKESLEEVLDLGWDLVIIDSIENLKDGLLEEGFSAKQAEKYIIDLMVEQNEAKNQKNKHTSFLCIQQVTKSGTFVGSNKLKHNTTGMCETRVDKNGKNYIMFTKNRRGFVNKKLYYKITDTGILFDDKSFKIDLELEKFAEAENEKVKNEELEFFNFLNEFAKSSEIDLNLSDGEE